MTTFKLVKHPLVEHKMGIIRKEPISTRDFRDLTKELTMLLVYEATRCLNLEEQFIHTWRGVLQVKQVVDRITVVPILRAGMGMLEGFQTLIPGAKVSVLGFYRDDTKNPPIPVEYYAKFASDMEERIAFVIDPMLATGGSSIAAIDLIKKEGCRRIKGIFLVAAPEGIKALQEAHPDVDIYVAAIDSHLDKKSYIIPGLGDAGDKIFGTK